MLEELLRRILQMQQPSTAGQIGGNYPAQAQQMLNSGMLPQDVIGSIHGSRKSNINLAPDQSMMQQMSKYNPFAQYGNQISNAQQNRLRVPPAGLNGR